MNVFSGKKFYVVKNKKFSIYKYKLAAKTMSLFNNLMASENLFSNSTFPIFFDA